MHEHPETCPTDVYLKCKFWLISQIKDVIDANILFQFLCYYLVISIADLTMLVQTERNQACLNCWGAAEYRRWLNLFRRFENGKPVFQFPEKTVFLKSTGKVTIKWAKYQIKKDFLNII